MRNRSWRHAKHQLHWCRTTSINQRVGPPVRILFLIFAVAKHLRSRVSSCFSKEAARGTHLAEQPTALLVRMQHEKFMQL